MKKKVLVLGMARSGYEAAKVLIKDYDVYVIDAKPQDEKHVQELENLGVKIEITTDTVNKIDKTFSLLVKNPGIKYDHPIVLRAKELEIPVINELELAYSRFPKNVQIVAVTGSNGKTTTTTIIYEILKESGLNPLLGGNIGIPVSKLLENVKGNSLLVLEVSDHQLCDVLTFRPKIAVLTNIFPVHLDFHDSYERYKEIKKRIFAKQTNADLAVINKDNQESLLLTNDINAKKMYFSTQSKEDAYLKNETIYYQNEKIISINDILIKGRHNYENILAAICVCKKLGASTSSIITVLKRFPGVKHRLQFVKKINGIKFYNDSKATNCESTKIALSSIEEPTCLLLGGLDRGHSFNDLKGCLQNVIYVAAFGQTKERIKSFCQEEKIPCDTFSNLEQATIACYNKAKKGTTILLSPACASWDQYASFEERGDEFINIVNHLEG